MIRRLLIANRGEIAVRIIRTCQRLGIEAVLGASEADLAGVPARLADRVVRLGPPPAAASYLNVDAVVAAARAVGADAVHPGYGFLSENARLAEACERAGIVFIGPTAEQLAVVGDKLAARRHALDAGLPVVPGGEVGGTAEAWAIAERLGWPVLVKAAGGGGGRGMRLVTEPAALEAALERAASEAGAVFGDARLYLERYVTAGRHVEVQVLADGADAVHLGDRDCSIQRRYQKLVEEAPAPGLDEELRSRMHQAAVAYARRLGYRGAGTVEFLVGPERGSFYFLEMNARIQVEHPVTEAITGVDLVAEQIAVAEGLPLRITQDAVALRGHAIECRINCEDWLQDFRPTPGTVTRIALPVGPGLRVDTHVQAGDEIPPYYDSLVAKLIASGGDRAEALARLRSALRRFMVEGVATTVPMHLALTQEPEFVAGGVDTTWFARFLQRRGGDRGHGGRAVSELASEPRDGASARSAGRAVSVTGGKADRADAASGSARELADAVDLLASYWTLAGPVELHTGREWSLFDVVDRVTAAANAGFRGLGLWHADLLHILEERGLHELRTILDDGGMVHVELEFLWDWFLDPGTDGRRRSDQRRRALLDAAGVLGARHVKVGNFAGRQVPVGLLTERFAELCVEAAEHGTSVAYEFMYRDATAGSLEAARSVVQGAGAANGGLALDLWHVVDLGVSTAAIRELPAGTVVAAEVSDGERSPRPGARRSMRDRRLPGDGDFDIGGFVAAVRAAGFQGPWGVELLSAVIGDVGPAELARRAYRSTIEHVARGTYQHDKGT